jgi:hypothetical protein
MKKIILSFIVGAASLCNAQIIDNRKGNVFEDENYFNQEFLWQNKIKSVRGSVSIKRPQRTIEQRPDVFIYRFNEVGLLTQLDKVSSVLHLVDSMTIEYKRNDLGEVELRTEKGNRGFFTKKFIYDKDGRVERLDFGKSENVSENAKELEAGSSIAINSESFKYLQQSDTVIRKSCYNNYGLLYSHIITTRNSLGYLLSEREELVMSNRSRSKNYYYNDKGWLDKIEWVEGGNQVAAKHLFYYDPLGNLLKFEKYKGEVMEQEVEVLYTEKMLIEAILDQDMYTKAITITKFTYEFYTLDSEKK